MNELDANSSLYKKRRKLYICKKTGKCTICPYHGGENRTRHPPRPDRYKNKRR